jgi:hypothetical protein
MVIALTALLRAGAVIDEQAIRAALQPHLSAAAAPICASCARRAA